MGFARRAAWGAALWLVLGAHTPDSEDPEPDPEPARARFSPFPIVSYAPETSLVLGALLVTTLRLRPERRQPDRRPSSLQVLASYSFARRGEAELVSRTYVHDEDWRLGFKLGWRRFPQRFWGVGDARTDDDERFVEDRWVAWAWLTRRVIADLRVGAGVRLRHRGFDELDPEGQLARNTIRGIEGGWEVGPFASIVWDDRDNNFSTQRGGRHEIDVTAFNETMGSDYAFRRIRVDLRQFIEVPGGVVALQVYAERLFGDVPFAALAALGGEDRMRGFFRGRYLDRALLLGQLEYRMPIWARLGAAAFVGLGAIAESMRALSLSELRVAGGFGLRFALDPKDHVNVRLDLARANDGSTNVYFTLGEAF